MAEESRILPRDGDRLGSAPKRIGKGCLKTDFLSLETTVFCFDGDEEKEDGATLARLAAIFPNERKEQYSIDFILGKWFEETLVCYLASKISAESIGKRPD